MNKYQFNLILNQSVHYYHNPFGGIDDDELLDIINPKHSLEELVQLLAKDEPIIIQFKGKKGRGKTTHLRVIHQLVAKSKIHFLDKTGNTTITTPTEFKIFIDSVHHIPLIKRFRLWRQSNISYVVTTHWLRDLEFYLCKRKFKTFHFKGITVEELEKIIKKRVAQFSSLDINQIIINTEVIHRLIKQFDDDIRGILNFLYDHFQTKSYGY